jgi:hypothetical protein
MYSHKITLEEFFQLPLSCRVGKVADVKTTTLGGTGMDGILVLVLAGEGGIAQSVGNVVDGIACNISNFLHGAGHFDLG